MGKHPNPRLIGAFVLGAVALSIVAIVVFGSGRLFRRTNRYVLFFTGDVSGLRVGAPVKFKGVQVGSVTGITLSFYKAGAGGIESASNVRIPVVIELNNVRIVIQGKVVQFDDPGTIGRLIALGLRGELRVESIVTGMLYVALDMEPESKIHLVLPAGSGFNEIPTVVTPFERAQTMATNVIQKLDKVDLDGFILSATQTLEAIRQLTNSPQLRSAIESLGPTIRNLNATALSVQRAALDLHQQLGPLGASFKASSDRTRATLKDAQEVLANVQTVLAPDSPLNYQLLATLKDVSEAARSVRELSDFLQRNPSALVRGKYESDHSP
jgi:phospholipid/cholesterol/gamma-HCH transport system substrate-binding protein